MPRPAPVTIATLPSSRNRSWIIRASWHGHPTASTLRGIPDRDATCSPIVVQCTTDPGTADPSGSPSPPRPLRPEVAVFASLGSWCFRRRKTVVLGWIVGVVVLGGVSGAIGGSFGQDFTLPASRAPVASRPSRTPSVVRAPASRARSCSGPRQGRGGPRGQGGDGAAVHRASTPSPPIRRIDVTNDPRSTGSPTSSGRARCRRPRAARRDCGWSAPTRRRAPPDRRPAGAEAGKIAFASIEIPGRDWTTPATSAGASRRSLPDARRPPGGARRPGLRRVRGALHRGARPRLRHPDPRGGLRIRARHGPAHRRRHRRHRRRLVHRHAAVEPLTMPDFAPFLGIMIGLGVGIDYALFIVTRYRENLHHGHTIEEAIVDRHRHGGPGRRLRRHHRRRVLPRHARHGRGLHPGPGRRAAVVVLMTVVASLTLLPALLGFAGERIERHAVARPRSPPASSPSGSSASASRSRRWRVGFPLAVLMLLAGFVRDAAQAGGRPPPAKPIKQTFAYRWSRSIQHRPWPAAIGGAVVLLVLAIPLLGLRLGFSDEGNYAEDTTTRQAYDLLADGFGPGFNGPLFLAAGVDGVPTRRCSTGSPPRSRPTPTWPSPRPAHPRKPGRRRPRRLRLAGDARDVAAGRGHHAARAPPARRRAPAGRGRARHARSPSPARCRPPSTSPASWPAGCRTSSRPSCSCRSSC